MGKDKKNDRNDASNNSGNSKVEAKKCENCDGRGILPEVDPSNYCLVCDGNGTVEATA